MFRTTQTENKDHDFPRPMDDPFGNAFSQQVNMQVSRNHFNKEASASCGLESPFDADSTTGGELPMIPWSQDLSSPLAAGDDHTQTFDDKVGGSKPNGLLSLDPASMFGCRKETGSGPCLQLPASARPSQQKYKYSIISAAKSVHSPSSSGRTASLRKQKNIRPSTPYLARIPLVSNCTMTYHESWSHHHLLENHGIQSHDRVPISQSPHLAIKQESLSDFTGMNCAQENIRRRSSQGPDRYKLNSDGHTQAPSIPSPCAEPLLTQRYPDQATSAPLSVSAEPQPHPVLSSQHSEMLPISPWHSASVDSPVYQYAHPENATHNSPVWWGESSASHRNMATFSQNGYQSIIMEPLSHRPHYSGSSTHQTMQNGAMMPLGPSTETLPMSGPATRASPSLPCLDSVADTPYPPSNDRAYEPLSQRSFFENTHRNTPPPHTQYPAEFTRRISTGGVHRSPKTKPQNTAPHRRRNAPRKQSTTAASTGSKGARRPASRNRNTCDATKGPVGFIFKENLTLGDGEHISKAVAPSGASKTKARRDRQALERYEAVLRAAAGGDVESIKAACADKTKILSL